MRDSDGHLVATSWPSALERAAQGLAEAADRGGVGVLPGGRLTEEDSYAYAKFARVALGTNDIDARARAGSAEELDFLAAHVAGMTPEHVSYADLEAATAVLLAGFEPEEESPIVFLRLRKSTRLGKTKVWSLAPFATHGLDKLTGALLPCVPGGEAAELASLDAEVVSALGGVGALIVVGERLATSPGALSAAASLATRTGARLVWVPRRAGDRGAVDAGALPTLLPGARPVADGVARAEVEAVWGADSVPAQPGRDAQAMLQAAADGALAALVFGGVDPADLPDPALVGDALEHAGFVVSLEIRHSAVTERADVVLPVAPSAEKSGRYVNWEGRRRPFDLVINGTGAMSDGRVLNALADELDVDLGLHTVEAARAEMLQLGVAVTRAAAPAVAASAPATPEPGEALLATWAELIDAGRMQDGDEHLAGTAKPVVARISAATAAEVGIADGDRLAISTDAGAMVLPASVEVMPDRVVWLPTNARGYPVHTTLRAGAAATVKLTAADAPPVVGLEGGQA